MIDQGFELEVCVDRLDHALAAAEAGATRIEFNQAFDLGGLTPSPSACEVLVNECPVPIIAMLRPHAYHFVYSQREKDCLLRECEQLLGTGIQGIAFGSLLPSGQLDFQFLSRVIALCGKREFVLHRAFDAVQHQLEALPKLVELGVCRILTSGGSESALAGCEQLRQLRTLASGQIEILPGAGVTAECLPRLVEKTGCNQFHGSFRLGTDEPNSMQIREARSILELAFAAS